MRRSDSASESFKEVLRTSARSPAFWSFVSGVVGLGAIALGGILYLTIDELRNFSVTALTVGISLLFLALVLSPRAVAIFLMGRQGRFGTNVIVMTVAFFAIALLVNFLMFRNTARFDTTATRIFTLSPRTIKVLEERIENKVRANAFFISDDPLAQQVEDLLDEYDRRTGKFTYRFLDPELERSLALQYNVTKYPTIVFEDTVTGIQQAISVFTEQEFVTGLLIVTGKQRKVVYNLEGHGERTATRDFALGTVDDEGFDFALEGLAADNYALKALSFRQTDRVPDDAAVVVIASPDQDMAPNEVEALTEYIKRGGRIVALFDPNTPDSFANLFGPWGVKLGVDSIADAASSVAGQALTPLVQRANGQYIQRFRGQATDSAATGIPIADQVSVTFFPGVTSIEPSIPFEDLPFHIRFVDLALTTRASWLEKNPQDISPDEDERFGPFSVASVIEATGTVDETERHPTAKFVIFGDSDFAKNFFYSSDDNRDLFLNAVNWLADDYELISIRPKRFPFRRLVINTSEADVIKWSSWFLPPSLMIILGTVVWWRRR